MNITTGKHIVVESGDFSFKRTAETPGGVTVTRQAARHQDPQVMGLPAQRDAAERFIAAYRRIIEEDVEYRKVEFEGGPVKNDDQ